MQTVDTNKRVAKLNAILERLRRGQNVQNRHLRKLLGEEGYARFLDDWCEQQELREDLKNKPNEILEYEKRLKESKAKRFSHSVSAAAYPHQSCQPFLPAK